MNEENALIEDLVTNPHFVFKPDRTLRPGEQPPSQEDVRAALKSTLQKDRALFL
ncbi:hypothetical protein HK102_000610, partial [Quaeritorhiza haematococci]